MFYIKNRYILMHVIIIFLTIYNPTYILCGEKILVNIDRTIREIDDQTSCQVSDWSNNISDACKCCLIKRIPELDKGKKAEDIVQECIAKGHCTNDLIATLSKRSANLDTALRQLYTTSVVIKKMDTNGIAFDNKGNLTEAGVKTLVEKAYAEGKLPYEDFKEVSCLKVKDIFAQEKGFASSQLFAINSTCSTQSRAYILKEMASKYSETRHLAEFFGLKQLDDLILPNHTAGYPSLAIPIAFLQYGDHYLSLMPQAPGQSLEKFIIAYFLNRNEANKKDLEQAYYDLGYAMAHFHQRFMKKENNNVLGPTVVHGDLHQKNIFYDKATHQVTLIDNETMPAIFKAPRPVIGEVAAPIRSGMSDLLLPKEIVDKFDSSSWIKLITVPYLKGYISGYPKKDWQALFGQLVDGFKTTHWYGSVKPVIEKEFEKIRQFIQTDDTAGAKSQPSQLDSALKSLEVALNNLTQTISSSNIKP